METGPEDVGSEKSPTTPVSDEQVDMAVPVLLKEPDSESSEGSEIDEDELLSDQDELTKQLAAAGTVGVAAAAAIAYLPTVPFSPGQSRFGDRNPTSRPTTQKSRFVPICPDQRPKHGFKPAFCLFSLFFSRNSSFFGVFWPFLMY